LYDSFVAKRDANCPRDTRERRAVVTREGRYRTPDRQRQIRMHETLRQRLKVCPVLVPRSEVEAMGGEIGLEAIEAARLFDRLKGVSWRGDYIRTDDGWTAAWVREIN
jgi:hypothetical protein